MNKLAGLTLSVFCAAVLGGCGAASNAVNTTNKANVNTNTSNVAVVVNNNSNVVANSNASNSSSNANVSRADYDKDRTKYEANKGSDTIGQGANDSWLWFKTKAALATVSGLSDSTINVDVDKDVITLKGTVKTAAEKAQAETAAKGIEGQKGVKNELKVDANDSMTNQMVNGNSSTKTSNANANTKK